MSDTSPKTKRKRATKTKAEAITALRNARDLANKVIDVIQNLELELEDIQTDVGAAMEKAEAAVDYAEEKIKELEKQ